VKPAIFISVAAYREFDLVNTLRDCFRNAGEPDRLRVCVCWQRDATDSLQELESDRRVDIIDVPYAESRGVCWARNLIQRRYGGEAYTLQIDGHHRFAAAWDRKLIEMIERLRHDGVAKPILTGYAPSFDPWRDPEERRRDVWGLGFDRFEPAGVVFMRPFFPSASPAPMPCRFWSAHFSFTLGRFNQEVVIDPKGYFHSEEIVMCVRAWTHGYDMFNPHETVLWHEYSRKGRICHWDDHSDWGLRNARAIDRYRRQLGVDGTVREAFEPHGLGTQRSLREYERFAGVEFATRGVQRYTIANGFPPDPLQHAPEEEWRRHLLTSYSAEISVDRARLDCGDCDMWRIFVYAEDGAELFREDYPRSRIDSVLAGQGGDQIQLCVSFCAQRQPHAWMLWPHSTARRRVGPVDGLWPRPVPPPVLEARSHQGG